MAAADDGSAPDAVVGIGENASEWYWAYIELIGYNRVVE